MWYKIIISYLVFLSVILDIPVQSHRDLRNIYNIMLEVYTVQVILKLHKNDEQLQAHFELILYFIEEFYLSKGINYSKFNFTYS